MPSPTEPSPRADPSQKSDPSQRSDPSLRSDASPRRPLSRAGGDLDAVLAGVGPRLRRLRQQRGLTLAALAAATGLSVSTLSRLESGLRRPGLELRLPIARAHQVPLDELVDAPPVGDPRVRLRPRRAHGMTVIPLTSQPGGVQAFKLVVPPRPGEPTPQVHEGYEWLYVMTGRVRLVLAEHEVLLGAGEAAEFDTRVPHWFGAVGPQPAELISLFGPQGERAHLRASPRRTPRAPRASEPAERLADG